MDKNKIKTLWTLFGIPACLILFGLILLLSPDSAVALVTKLIAWILIIAGILTVAKNLMNGSAATTMVDWLWAVLFLLVGGYMLANPLTISNLLGRILGILLVIQGANDLRKSRYGAAKTLGAITLVGGIVLILLPRTLTNTLLGFCGLVLIAIGVINLLGKLREYKQLGAGSDPNIIDADE